MDRKKFIPLIAVAAFILFVIGAGVTAVTVQIRKNAPPAFSETDRDLRLLPASTGWTFVEKKAEPPKVQSWRGWWNLMGIRRQRHIQQTIYTFSHYESTGRGKITIGHDGEKILSFQAKGSFPEQTDALKQAIFKQFPKLGSVHDRAAIY